MDCFRSCVWVRFLIFKKIIIIKNNEIIILFSWLLARGCVTFCDRDDHAPLITIILE